MVFPEARGMAIQRTTGKQPTSGAQLDAVETVEKTSVPDDVAKVEAPETRPVDAKGDLHTRTAAEQLGARGNLAAILAAQNAGRPVSADVASLASLTGGRAFGPRAAQGVERIMGHPVTREGLARLYGSVLPDTHVFLSGVKADPYRNTLEFTVEWRDNQGQPVAKLNRRLARHEEGDLELYSHGCWVEPSHRSRAVSAAVMQREIELLKNLSPHARSRLTLWAGGVTDPKNPKSFERVGHYVWATMGFDCAETHGRRSRMPRGGANKLRNPDEQKSQYDLPDFEFVQEMVRLWVDRAVERGDLPDDEDVLGNLVAAFGACPDMFSVATLDVPGLEVDVMMGGRKSTCPVGKAFLLSDESPRWEGVFLVRDPKFAEIGSAYCGPRVTRANEAFETRKAALVAVLDGDDQDARLDALSQLALAGDRDLVPVLEQLRDAEPALAEAAQAAIDGITGVALTNGLFAQTLDPNRSVKDRLRALDLALDRDPDRRMAALKALVAAPDTAGDFEVARTALDRLARSKADPDTLLDAAFGLWKLAVAPAPAEEAPARDKKWGRPQRSGQWQREETRSAALRCLDSLRGPGATEALATIAKEDPDRELASTALAAWVRRAGQGDPAEAFAAAKAFIDRSRRLHEGLERGDRRRSAESRARNPVIEAIGWIDTPDAIAFLERAIDAEPFYEGIRAALRGLQRQVGREEPGRVARPAARWLRDATNSPTMRADCIDILAELLPEPTARDALLGAARREDDERPLRALQHALRDMDGADAAFDAVHERLRALAGRRERDRKW